MTTDKRGVSALLLQRQLGLARYETSWMMLHKLRRAIVAGSLPRLDGDESTAEQIVSEHGENPLH